MIERDAVVVGGGFGGLAAALALREAGVNAVVLERRDAQATRSIGSGAGLTLWSNAIAALDRLGVGDRVIASGSALTAFENRTSTGKTLSRWPVDQMSDQAGWPSINIEWDVLRRILFDAVGPDVVKQAICTGLAHHADRVTAQLADGSEVSAGMLVGADGLRSAIRRALLGDVAPRYAGYDVLRAVVPFDHPDVPPGRFIQTWGVGSRFGCYKVGAGRTYWFAVVNGTGDASPTENHRQFLLDRMQGWAGAVGELIGATPETAISRIQIHDRNPVAAWGSGRATLLGDAAHPMTFNVGQGACQAIEDALELGSALSASADTIAALRAYEAARLPRTSTLVLRARRIGSIGRWESPAACALRNAALSRILPSVARRQHEQSISPVSRLAHEKYYERNPK